MKVLKFGGTSVGSVQSLLNVKKIVEAIPGNAVIVVSALGGLTDKLIETANMAARGDENWSDEWIKMADRHYIIINEVVAPEHRKDLIVKVEELLNGLKRNYEGVFLLGALPEKILDLIVSFGERISSLIVAAMVQNGKRYFSPDFVKTEKRYGKNIADIKLTDKLIKETFANIEENEKAIVPGFISMDVVSAQITNLGRGGSDFTGALIAAALEAEVLEIWTDVSGFMTADPRIVKDALIIDHLTFTESMELCTFGAKVIYPPTIFPVFHKNIPIRILNTFKPRDLGTLITDKRNRRDFDVKGVTALKGVSLIHFEFHNASNTTDLIRRAYRLLSQNASGIIPLENHEPYLSYNIAVAASDTTMLKELLEKELAPEITAGKVSKPQSKENLAAMAVVGKDMKGNDRLAARIANSLNRHNINVEAQSATNSQTTLIFLIPEEKIPAALPLTHNLLY